MTTKTTKTTRDDVKKAAHEALKALEAWTLMPQDKQTYVSLNELHKKLHTALEIGCRDVD